MTEDLSLDFQTGVSKLNFQVLGNITDFRKRLYKWWIGLVNAQRQLFSSIGEMESGPVE